MHSSPKVSRKEYSLSYKLVLAQWYPYLTSELQDGKIINLLCFKAIGFMVIYYNSIKDTNTIAKWQVCHFVEDFMLLFIKNIDAQFSCDVFGSGIEAVLASKNELKSIPKLFYILKDILENRFFERFVEFTSEASWSRLCFVGNFKLLFQYICRYRSVQMCYFRMFP